MLFDRIEIPIRMQQVMSVLQAESGDQHVDGLDWDASGAKPAVMADAGQGDVAAGDRLEQQRPEDCWRLSHVPVMPKTLQDFYGDQVPDDDLLGGEIPNQLLRFLGLFTIKIVDPD